MTIAPAAFANLRTYVMMIVTIMDVIFNQLLADLVGSKAGSMIEHIIGTTATTTNTTEAIDHMSGTTRHTPIGQSKADGEATSLENSSGSNKKGITLKLDLLVVSVLTISLFQADHTVIVMTEAIILPSQVTVACFGKTADDMPSDFTETDRGNKKEALIGICGFDKRHLTMRLGAFLRVYRLMS